MAENPERPLLQGRQSVGDGPSDRDRESHPRHTRSHSLPPVVYSTSPAASPSRPQVSERRKQALGFGYKELAKKDHATTVWYDELQDDTVASPKVSPRDRGPSSFGSSEKPEGGGATLRNFTFSARTFLPSKAEAEADKANAGLRKRRFKALEDAFTPHVFEPDERKRMDGYESIDYFEPRNLVYAEYLISIARSKHTRHLKWIVFVMIGVAVGLWSVLMFQTIFWLADVKLSLLERIIAGRWLNIGLDNPNEHGMGSSASSAANFTGSGSSAALYNVTTGRLASPLALFEGYLFFMGWSLIAVLFSSLSCIWIPTAAGSGIPDVMAYLNGIMWPRVFNLRTLFVKTFSCILAVNAGLPVGGEGPIIHIGSLIGAGLPTGRSRTLGRKASTDHSFFAQFRNSKDHRDFISAGAACGVTGAFGSPIGGLLFVMEEIATYFPSKTAWMVFVSTMSCVTVMSLFNSYIDGWVLRDRSKMGFGNFADEATALFETQGAPGQVSMNWLNLIPAVILGIIMGLVAVVLTLLNIKGARFRAKYVNRTTFRRVLEPLIVIFVFGSLSFAMCLAFECRPIPEELQRQELFNIKLMKAFCEDPVNEYHPLATVSLTSSYNLIRMLYTRKTGLLIPWPALLSYWILYTLGAAYTGGVFLSSGMVIPTLVVGALGGRLIGQFIALEWADSGMTALVGSAAFFGGLARLTYSVTCIMLEISNDLNHIVIIMVAVIVARTVANRFCHALYHQQLEVKCAPFLDDAVQMLHWLDTNCAGDIMASPVVTLKTAEQIRSILTVLTTCKHSGFPVVSVKDGKSFRGLILRSGLEELLWYLQLYVDEQISKGNIDANSEVANFAPPHASIEDLQKVKEFQFWERKSGCLPENLPDFVLEFVIDLNPYIDQSAYFVHERFCISRTFNLFRQLGLRHLTVLTRTNEVCGIITRKNLIGDRMNEAIQRTYEVGVTDSSRFDSQSPTLPPHPDSPLKPGPNSNGGDGKRLQPPLSPLTDSKRFRQTPEPEPKDKASSNGRNPSPNAAAPEGKSVGHEDQAVTERTALADAQASPSPARAPRAKHRTRSNTTYGGL